ncbi:unnamed protein product [Parnassius apollo]|uniref:glyceraldehyde-3-phosphate dehydrogenase (phosphorylating) n=1 Tax=Parnassius apollo TaxID=110799 RepID=A0A8S3XSA6_PARAO|nr:unnamed protein product [Parnassius apollo]
MVVKVGINGFGRIGRILFRTCFENSNIEVSAINDPAIDVEYICYLMKFDSTHGKLNATIESYNDDIKINGNLTKIFHEKQPAAVPWQSAGVQYVIESSGMFTSLEKALGHLSGGGVRRVVVTAPSVDVPMIILGVNDDKLHPDQKVISCASSTLYCLAPIMKVLENDFGVAEGFVTSIHAMTPSLKPLDGLCLRGKHWRDHRSIHQNIIPAITGACKVLGKILPQSKDKMIGLNKDTKLQNIVRSVENASKTYLKGIINISKEEAVSSDFNKDTHSCILDVNSSMQHKSNFFKLVCWYENEFSYACRVIDSIFFSEKQYNQNIEETNLKSLVIRQKNLTRESLEYVRRPYIVGCNCTTDTLPNVLKDVSKSMDFKIKPRYSQIFRKSPFSSQISVINQSKLADWKTKNGSDIPKTLDYDEMTDKSASKHNKKSFFKSCISLKLPSADRKDTKKVRNGLENVKREFNKMVNITEELLKKSKEHQFNRLKTVSSESKIEYNLNESQKEPDLIKINVNNDNIFNKNASKIQTDNLLDNKYLNKENKYAVTQNSEAIILKNVDKNLTIDKKSKECIEGDDRIALQEESNIHVKILYDFFESNARSRISSEIISEQAVNELQEYKTKNNIQKYSFHEIPTSPINVMSHECHLITKKKSEKQIQEQYLVDESLEAGNTITSRDGITTVLENKNAENIIETVTFGKTEDYLQPVKTVQNESKTLRRIVDKQNDLAVKQVISRNILLRPSQETTNTSIYKDVNETNDDDIYDKLDSTSATNSDNSFHMNEKQSQVIYINELTNSLDDLSRLEKICRIIEISDDLSNQLFSTLKDGDTTNMKNKKWSFKDLCEKIQLDEFCNKVFGQTNK